VSPQEEQRSLSAYKKQFLRKEILDQHEKLK
jgi:hypothetical protein